MNIASRNLCAMCIEMEKMMYYVKLSTVFISKTEKIPYTHIHILIYMRQKNTDQRYKNLEKKQYQEQLMHININRRMFN